MPLLKTAIFERAAVSEMDYPHGVANARESNNAPRKYFRNVNFAANEIEFADPPPPPDLLSDCRGSVLIIQHRKRPPSLTTCNDVQMGGEARLVDTAIRSRKVAGYLALRPPRDST